ncbi:mechanosensitive ion channel [Acuticoccus sp. MNP-M23]|uniref:mechanosensitive ion channel family protein n=1 Tax=Acuticoccus sp. MNP-M23 TaxID=3072793 RepID=UPI002814D6F0|nr:mechanosensitive ion channel domain-containing protein [Acuticoccus sp. MNP-M23]WMS42197.1 mechanosensitive ion channel [Acuticoccus sp. MNP-M23]
MPSTANADVSSAVELLEAGGNAVIVMPVESEPAAQMLPVRPPLTERIASIRGKLDGILAEAPGLPAHTLSALRAAGGGSLAWLWPALFISVVACAIGSVALLLVRRMLRPMGRAMALPPQETRSGMILRGLGMLAAHTAGAAAFGLAGVATVIALRPALSPERVSAMMAVGMLTIFLFMRAVLIAILAPQAGALRALPFSDRLARMLYLQFLVTIFLTNAIACLCYWLANFPVLQRSHQLLLILSPTVSVILFIGLLMIHRTELTAALAGNSPRPRPIRRLLALAWPVLFVGYLLIAWAIMVAGVVEDTHLAIGPVLAPFLALVVGMAVAGVLIVIHDRWLANGVSSPAWGVLYERVAVGVGTLAGFAALAGIWRVFSGVYAESARTLFGLALLVLLAWAAWQAVRLFVALRLEAEAGTDDGEASEGDGFGPGASRLSTLLPILRSVFFFAIVSVVTVIVLASLGVNVAPLFAGAGVVGLAIGFGAQSLIRDVFSGAFFLLDDAFRRGEYVQVGSVAGQVEKISVRSFQLRHQNGPLHTIPFGEIKQLSNFSRDWVIMKLPVRLTYDTDVEKVRKIVKKLGQELAADPELGPLFMEPPKSQGVVQMEDSAMIMRVKFKTKPGDQFLVRRHVFQGLRDTFAANDIHFAHREVTVRVAGEEGDDGRRQAAARGAARMLEDDTARSQGSAADAASAL